MVGFLYIEEKPDLIRYFGIIAEFRRLLEFVLCFIEKSLDWGLNAGNIGDAPSENAYIPVRFPLHKKT